MREVFLLQPIISKIKTNGTLDYRRFPALDTTLYNVYFKVPELGIGYMFSHA